MKLFGEQRALMGGGKWGELGCRGNAESTFYTHMQIFLCYPVE